MPKKDAPEKLENESRMQDETELLNPRVLHPVPHKVSSTNENGNRHQHRHRYLLHVLVITYGIGACIGVNAITAEIPLLIASAPEGALLLTHLVVVASLAFAAPAMYALCVRVVPRLVLKKDVVWISAALIIGTTSMGLQAFFHDVRTTISGNEHSTVMLVLVFVSATVTGTRNVLMLPYLRNFGASYLTSFCIGESLSGFIPSIAALIQGVGGNPICPNNSTNSTHLVRPPNFPPRDFLLFVTAILASATIAFWIMEYLRDEKFPEDGPDVDHRYDRVSTGHQTPSKKLSENGSSVNTDKTEMMEIGNPESTCSVQQSGKKVSKKDRIYLYIMLWVVCFVANGYLNTVEAYSSRPYGNSVHNLVVNLSQLASTAACTCGFWIPLPGLRGMTRILVPAAVGTTYVSWLALSSPTPLWHDTIYGVVLLVTVWIILMGLAAYARFAIVAIFYHEPGNDSLYVAGFLALVGTICGSGTTFVLFNYTTLFTPHTACEIIE